MTKVSTTDVNNIKERVKVNLEKAPEFSIPFVIETFSLKQLQIIMKSLDPLRAKKIFIRKKLGHTAVSAIKASSVTL